MCEALSLVMSGENEILIRPVLFNNSKSHMAYRMVPIPMTLKDTLAV